MSDTITFEPNAAIKVSGHRVQIIGHDEARGVFHVLHGDGTDGWGIVSGFDRDNDDPIPSTTVPPEVESGVTPPAPVTWSKANSTPARDADGSERPDLTRCAFATDKGRRCKLGEHDDKTAHVFAFRSAITAPKSLADLRKADDTKETFAAFALVSEEVPDNEDLSRERNLKDSERDDDQLRTDADALASYTAWVAAGRPEKFEDMGTPDAEFGKPVRRYIFPPVAFDTIQAMLRRATQKGGPVAGKKLEYRRKQHESGNAMIYYRIVDDAPKKDEPKPDDAVKPDDASAETTPEENTDAEAARLAAEASVAEAQVKESARPRAPRSRR